MKSKRMFICSETLSTLALTVPSAKHSFDTSYEVTARDCSRQIHWLFSRDRAGLRKARKVAKFFNDLVAELEEKVGK